MDVPKFTPQQMITLRRIFHVMNHFMVFLWKIGLGRAINIWPAGFGRILVIRHRGRKSGKEYLTPLNYAIMDGHIYCTAGFVDTGHLGWKDALPFYGRTVQTPGNYSP